MRKAKIACGAQLGLPVSTGGASTHKPQSGPKPGRTSFATFLPKAGPAKRLATSRIACRLSSGNKPLRRSFQAAASRRPATASKDLSGKALHREEGFVSPLKMALAAAGNKSVSADNARANFTSDSLIVAD